MRSLMPQWKKDSARAMRKNPTRSEELLWQALRKKALGVRFRRQAPMYGYIADFYCPSAKLVVEVDGASHNGRAASDVRRDTILRLRGIRTLRVSASAVENHLPDVLGAIRTALSITP